MNLMSLHGLKESLNLTYFIAIQRIFLKTNALVNLKRKRGTIEVATVSVMLEKDGISRYSCNQVFLQVINADHLQVDG